MKLENKINKHREKLIKQGITDCSILNCQLDGIVKNYETGMVEYQFKPPYQDLVHTYSIEKYEKELKEVTKLFDFIYD